MTYMKADDAYFIFNDSASETLKVCRYVKIDQPPISSLKS